MMMIFKSFIVLLYLHNGVVRAQDTPIVKDCGSLNMFYLRCNNNGDLDCPRSLVASVEMPPFENCNALIPTQSTCTAIPTTDGCIESCTCLPTLLPPTTTFLIPNQALRITNFYGDFTSIIAAAATDGDNTQTPLDIVPTAFSNLSDLEEINFSRRPILSPLHLKVIPESVTSVSLRKSSITTLHSDTIASLANRKNEIELDLRDNPDLEFPATILNDASFSNVKLDIRDIQFTATELSDGDVDALASILKSQDPRISMSSTTATCESGSISVSVTPQISICQQSAQAGAPPLPPPIALPDEIVITTSSPGNDVSSSSSNTSSVSVFGIIGIVFGILAIGLIVAISAQAVKKRHLINDTYYHDAAMLGAISIESPVNNNNGSAESVAFLSQDKELCHYRLDASLLSYQKPLGNAVTYRHIWLARYNAIENVAVRRLDQEAATELDASDMAREIKALGKINHPNIVKFVGTVWSQSYRELCVIASYSEINESFHLIVRNADFKISTVQKLVIIRQIVSALRHLSIRQLAFDGLQDRRIWFNRSTMTCQLDLFYVRSTKGGEGNDGKVDVVFGADAIAFMPPEVLMMPHKKKVLNGFDHDAAAVYTVGVLLYEIMNRKVPYSDILSELGPTQGEIKIQQDVVAGNLRPTVSTSDDDESSWVSLMNRCCEFIPASRPSLGQVLLTLDQLLKEENV